MFYELQPLRNLLIDLGWYPAYDINGNYVLELIRNFDWDRPLKRVVSKSKNDIIYDIEKWVCYDCLTKF